MKTCIVLFVLVTLTIYCRGRTRWRMIEYDVDVDKSRAFTHCMKNCAKNCENSTVCKTPPNDPDTLCRKGPSNDVVFMIDGKPFHGCNPLILRTLPQPDEPKRPFEVADLWKLFEAK